MRSFSQHGWQKEHLPDCCRSVTAPRLRLMKRLTYLNCWIWLAGYGVIPSCARSPAFLSGIFQCAFCLPVSYPHTRHERIPGRDHLSRKSSSHKVLTEKHVLRGGINQNIFLFSLPHRLCSPGCSSLRPLLSLQSAGMSCPQKNKNAAALSAPG